MIRRHSPRWFAGLALAACVVSSDATGQTITGTVVDSATGVPVGTGFVVLVDTLGRELVRALTASNGTFEIRSPRTGFVRLRSERIGYRPWESPNMELELRQTIRYRAAVSALPVRLAAIEARSETSCRLREEESRAVTILWEEARKALAAASWNAEQGLYRQTLITYERDLDVRRRRVQAEKTIFTTGLYEVPFRSRDPETLAADGYLTYDGDANWYFAPDADVLLHETFHNTHCFGVVEGEDDQEGLIGLAFEPVPDIDRPDVRGRLWIDLESAELRYIEYSYTGLSRDIADSRIGGTIEFLPMPTGAWIVHKWQIRTPFIRSEARFGGGTRQVLDGFRDAGGEVLVVTELDGTSVYSAPTAIVEGFVVDSSQGDFPQPLTGGVVAVSGTSFSSLTGNRGQFRIEAPLHGRYELVARHSRFDSLGIDPPVAEVDLTPGHVSEVSFGLGSMESIRERHCENPVPSEHAMMIVGVVRDRYATPIPEATIRADWQVFPVVRESMIFIRDNLREVRSDADGRFVICDVPYGALVTLRGSKESDGGLLNGSYEVLYNRERQSVRIGGRGSAGQWFYAPDPVLKIDMSLSPPNTAPQR